MIKSMTGFASVSREHELATIGVTVRSVNHRYLDVQIRLGKLLSDQEVKLRGLVQRWIARGRIELTVTSRLTKSPDVDVSLNEPLVKALALAVEDACQQGFLTGVVTSSDFLRFPQAVVVREREIDELSRASVSLEVAGVVEAALRELDEMRIREGTHLRADLDAKRSGVLGMVNRLATLAELGQDGLMVRLKARVQELTAFGNVDDTTTAQEIVRFAARSDVSEELVRLHGHLEHWSTLIDSGEPCGRRLDFLLQEMNREVNTLGSKIEGAEISELVVSVKGQLEQLREQVQNVE